MKILVAVLFFTSVIVMSSCATTPEVKPTGMTQDAFWKDQSKRASETEALSGNMLVHYEAKRGSGSGKAKFLSRDPNVRIEVKDPLGRVQCVLVLEGTTMTAYYPGKKEAYVDGMSGQMYLKRFLGMSLNLHDLDRLMVGVLPLKTRQFEKWEWDPEKGAYRGDIIGKQAKAQVWVDGESAAAKEIRFEFPTDTVDIVYSDFAHCCSQASFTSVGQAVSVEMEKGQTKLSVEWEAMDAMANNKSPEAFRLTLPEDVKKIPLK